MEKKLAVIVDNNEEITTGAGNTEMCSCGTDVVMEMCSPESHDTCGDGLFAIEETLILCGFEDVFWKYVTVFCLQGMN